MTKFEEIAKYVEQIVRRKTINYPPDVRDDILGEAMLKLWIIWPKIELPCPKLFLEKTFAHFPYKVAHKYMGDPVHLPAYFAENGVYMHEHLNRLDELLANLPFEVSDKTRWAITHALHASPLERGIFHLKAGSSEIVESLEDQAPLPDKKAERLDILKKLLAWLTDEEYLMIVKLASGVSQAELAREKGCTRQNIEYHVKKILNRIEKEINK